MPPAKKYQHLDGRAARLAPLRGLLSSAEYWNGTDRLESAVQVAGEYPLARISAVVLLDSGARFGVDRTAAGAIVQDRRSGVVAASEEAAAARRGADPEADRIADDLLAGVRRLPLVLA